MMEEPIKIEGIYTIRMLDNNYQDIQPIIVIQALLG